MLSCLCCLCSVPTENVATIKNSACVTEGVSRSRNALINGETRQYDWDSGYTCHQLGSGAIVVQLAQPYMISSMRSASPFVCPSIRHLSVPLACDVSTISDIGLSISLLSLCPIGLLAQPYMISSMRSAPPFACLPFCYLSVPFAVHPSLSIHPSIHHLSVPSAYDVSAHLCHLSIHVCIYLSVMCPSVSVIGLSIVCPSVCHFSAPSVCDVSAHLCHWSVHLCASVQPSFSPSS